MSKRIFIYLMLVVAGLLPVVSAWADDNGDADDVTDDQVNATVLIYNAPVTGQINEDVFTQQWTLEFEGVDFINISAERTDGNLIPDVTVFDATGRAVAQSRGADRSLAVANITRWRPAQIGIYTVEVGRDRGENGTTTGSYTLIVTPLATGADHPNNTTPIDMVEYGTPINGEITNLHWFHIYTLNVEANDFIRIRSERVNGTIAPEVQIIDNDGRSLRTGQVNDEGTTATLDYQLPSAGDYAIVVTRVRGANGLTEGEYQMTVDLIGAGEGSSLLAGTVGTITYDTPVSGSIGARWHEDWELVLDSGDTITVVVERDPDSSLQPIVRILGGSLQEMRRGDADDTLARASIERYTVPSAGIYYVRVSRIREKNGVTSGDYTLTVNLDGIGASNPVLAEPVGDAELDMSLEGTITNQQWANVWTYRAESGEQVNLTVTRTDGTLIPLVEVQDINGQTLRTGRPEASGDVAILANYRFPNAGEYRIVVLRNDQQNGFTTGDYSLLIEHLE